MGNALKGTPEAWVSLDNKAKAPQRELNQLTAEQQQDYRASPPLARPLYRPAPAAPVRAPERDFDDLPSEEVLIPDNNTPPPMQTPENAPTKPTPAPKPAPDALENLIDEVL